MLFRSPTHPPYVKLSRENCPAKSIGALEWLQKQGREQMPANANPAMDFQSLTTSDRWTALQIEGISYAMAATTLSMDGIASVQDPGLPSGVSTPTEAAVFQGTYALTSTPESATLRMFVAACGVLLCLCRLSARKRRLCLPARPVSVNQIKR